MQYSVKKLFNYIKFNDILHMFLTIVVFPFAIICKIFIRDFWLICEDENEARDNGYWFFKWVREKRPKQKVAYAINKKSPDYKKVKPLGKVISYGSISHWFWYIVADKNVSSQKGGKPNAAVCYFFEVVLKMRKNNRIFLQHGVIKDDLEWLYYKNCYFKLFVTSALPEYNYLVERFGYPENRVQLLGLSRFDNLHNIEIDENVILVMPTWRSWLGRSSRDNKNLVFTETDYFIKWNNFINSQRLNDILCKYGKKLLFYPHRNMQKFISFFNTDCERVEIADWKKYDIQEVLKISALMITDYSSVFFDFAYMRKPVLFYQFDETEFREKQYAQGYFDYHDTVLGKWTDDEEKLLDLFEESLQKGTPLTDESVIKEFFPLWDDNNSKRIYDAIKEV